MRDRQEKQCNCIYSRPYYCHSYPSFIKRTLLCCNRKQYIYFGMKLRVMKLIIKRWE